MTTLAKLLDQVLQQTSFEFDSARLPRGHALQPPGELTEARISPTQLHEMLNRGRLDVYERQALESLQPRVPQDLMTELTESLRRLFADHMAPESNLIRHVFPVFHSQYSHVRGIDAGLSKDEYVSNINEVAKGLIQGAAILGSEQTAELLSNWIGGEPLQYRTSGVLVGLRIEEDLDLLNGLSVKPLPISSDELPVSFPKDDSTPIRSHLGRPVLSIESTMSPSSLQ